MSRLKSYFFPHDSKKDHFLQLDGLRGIAVLFVLLSHGSNDGYSLFNFIDLAGMGKIGVYLFFVLSAYLLDRQIASALIRGRTSIRYWANYFMRRFLRIYPLFILSLFVHFILNENGVETVIQSYEDINLHLLLQKGESMFWSIPVEFKYYFISPFIMIFCHHVLKWKTRSVIITILAFIFITVAIQLTLHLDRVSTLRYFPIFLTGTLISILELIEKEKIENLRNSKKLLIVGYISTIIIVIMIPSIFKLITGIDTVFHHSVYYFFWAIIWSLILLSIKYTNSIISLLFKNTFLRYVGNISFGLYLFHKPVLHLINDNVIPVMNGLEIYAFVAISLFISSITYLLIERPLSMVRIRT